MGGLELAVRVLQQVVVSPPPWVFHAGWAVLLAIPLGVLGVYIWGKTVQSRREAKSEASYALRETRYLDVANNLAAVLNSGGIQGVLCIDGSRDSSFDTDDQQIAEVYASLAGLYLGSLEAKGGDVA